MNMDKYSFFMVLMISLVIIVVSVSQYQQFSLNSNNNVKLGLINELLQNQTEDLLNQLASHRNDTQMNVKLNEIQTNYQKDTNKIAHEILNIVKNQTHNQK